MSEHKITTEQIRDYHRMVDESYRHGLMRRMEADFPSVFTPPKKPLGELPVGTLIRCEHVINEPPVVLRVAGLTCVNEKYAKVLLYGLGGSENSCYERPKGFLDYQIVKPPPAEDWEVVEDE